MVYPFGLLPSWPVFNLYGIQTLNMIYLTWRVIKMDKFDLILNMLEELTLKVEQLDSKVEHLDKKVADGFTEVNYKLDYIKEQTAANTEYQYDIRQIEQKVSELETDVKLIKKAITNQ
jgi:peptidoglycan hydrolase CwlO-like protein